ncbi:uncharacterized protein LAJ45_10271 [Morchella importuna]|uniref:uncharacterized protein n=1 Tax=Morchella importuna TaxID=1174673 RepID=UPI001E8DAB66|nr:uncharacterized protein LAJ45_10271 [Morchella importuna]KAH8145631.1 hypothetical protein LAJ45_10271 [Morchella importuna]
MAIRRRDLVRSVKVAAAAYRRFLDTQANGAKEAVIEKTRETLELANQHAQETIPAPHVLPVASNLSVQPNAAENRPGRTTERAKRWLRTQAKTLMFWVIISFCCVAVFGCISAAISTLPGGVKKPSRVRGCEIIIHLILAVNSILLTRADTITNTVHGAIYYCVGLTVVTILEGALQMTKAWATFKDVQGPAPVASDKSSLAFEIAAVAFRCVTTIVVAVIACKLRRLPKADTPQVVRDYIILGGPGEFFSDLDDRNIAPLLTTLYRSDIIKAVIGVKPINSMWPSKTPMSAEELEEDKDKDNKAEGSAAQQRLPSENV